ncbi:MAG: rhomboid family intramembrane serine protease [Spirochaetes bacterium]|nr:rhomboid family intramembrane serine protease [Spirochaetota bacterium]
MYQQRQIRIGGPLTPIVKGLLIANAAFFILTMIIESIYGNGFLKYYLGLSYNGIMHGMYWQLGTYMFMHDGFWHLFFNCFAIWMFAGELEEKWGSNFFFKYYVFSGLGAGFFILLLSYLTDGLIPTVGASGAIFALLLAYGINWPDREVLIYFIFPIKMKYVVLLFGLFEFVGTMRSLSGFTRISHIGHLGGLISGFLILLFTAKLRAAGFSRGRKNKSFFGGIVQKQKNRSTRERIETRIKAQKIIDALLEKIAASGLESLTPEEKRDLEWARKNYYPSNEDIMH